MGILGCIAPAPVAMSGANQEPMTVEEAGRLGEAFGVIVGDVDEAIKKELKLERAQGVAVFEVIGSSRADYAGIKVRSIIERDRQDRDQKHDRFWESDQARDERMQLHRRHV